MKRVILFFILIPTTAGYSQSLDTIRLADFKLCELTIDWIKQKDSALKVIKLEEMDLCSDGFLQDSRFENRVGFESSLYPGIVFQKYEESSNVVAKLHLTREFKGYLPDGNYIDLRNVKAKNVFEKYDSLTSWTSRSCSDYWTIKNKKELYFYVKINKDKVPRYPVDEEYYSEQQIVGIDIIANCYTFNKYMTSGAKPLYILEGKEITEEVLKNINVNNIESLNVLKEENAIRKYGQKAKNGVIEIFLKKNK